MRYTLIAVLGVALAMTVVGGIAAQGQLVPPIEEPPIVTTSAPLFSAGDQYFSISAGGYFPLFLLDPRSGNSVDTNQNIGGQVALAWNISLNSFLTLGVETAYIFANTPNDRILSLWPTAIQFGLTPRFGSFFTPIHLDVGVIFSYFGPSTKLDLLLRGGIGAYWFFSTEWAVGIDVEYYFVPQLYDGGNVPTADNRILNSLVGSIGVIYKL